MFSLNNLRFGGQGRPVGLYARLLRRPAAVAGPAKPEDWRRVGSVSGEGAGVIVEFDEVWPSLRPKLAEALQSPTRGWPRIELAVREGVLYRPIGEVPMPPADPDEEKLRDAGTGGPSPVRSRWPMR